jgi:protocatechuate 3,4-dioxygenase beta subunit
MLAAAAALLGIGLSAWAATAALTATADEPPKAGRGTPAARAATAARPDQMTTPITVSGRATDEAGKSVPGATVYLASTRADTPLATATTDRDGRYRFHDVPLPVFREQEDLPADGGFQVFGTATGHGFAWHGMRSYQPRRRPADWKVAGEDYSLFQGEPLVMDLTFPPSAALGGRIVDEDQRPVPGAKIQIIGCDYLDTKGKESHPNFREFWSIAAAPAVFTTATTDDDGRCRFEGLPREAGFRIIIKHPDHATQFLYAVTTGRPASAFDYPRQAIGPGRERPPVRSAIFAVLRATRRIAVRTVFADNGLPAPRVRVSATIRPSGTSAGGISDDDGMLLLRLPAGEYDLRADPTAGGADCIRTLSKFTVAAGPAEQLLEVHVNPGCVVVLEVVDAATGKGIPGVTFLGERDDERGSKGWLQSRTGFIDNPHSNAEGRLRAVVAPGGGTFSLGRVPKSLGYRNDAQEKHVPLPARETVTVRFELRK